MNLESRLKAFRSIIDKKLDEHLPSAAAYPRSIHKAMRYSVFSGGKRLRPILVMESCEACGANIAKALPAACAAELVHTYSLIHDDLPAMDDDDIRRGKPTLHRKYGEATAILAGDALLTLAFMVIAKCSRSISSGKMVEELANASGTLGMIGGQVLDLEFANKRKDKKLINYINLHKTARLFEASCKIGAISACAERVKIDALGHFGRFLGLSFQIIDDIIDEGDYVKTLGALRARKDAQELAKRAKDSLCIFGDDASNLRELADHLLTRTT